MPPPTGCSSTHRHRSQSRAWGGGLLASVDGLRFVVPVRTINAGPSPKYFGYKRGITWLNAVNDQVAGIGQMVVPGTPRDSLFILDTLLNLDAGPKPEVVATDKASYSDMVFGVFAILNYRFAPRFADLPDQRYWRAALPEPLPANVDLSPEQQAIGGYGPLEPIARNTVNVARLSPLGHAHLNCLGRYAFTTQPPAELRPLRDPNARDGEDDGEF